MGDSLEQDFPYFDESDPEGTYAPVFVDVVVANPPYSQKWNPEDKEQDPRFANYGLALAIASSIVEFIDLNNIYIE